MQNMLAACCYGILTIGLKNIIELYLRIENPYIKQRRIANPPRRGTSAATGDLNNTKLFSIILKIIIM